MFQVHVCESRADEYFLTQMKKGILLTLCSIWGVYSQSLSVCPQCPQVSVGKFPFQAITYYNGVVDCFCGDEGRRLLDCQGGAPTSNFPFEGNDCSMSILLQETEWMVCIYSRPRIMLPDVARQLYACGAKVSAVKTNIDGSHPGATKITPTSTPTSNSSLFDGIQSSTLIFGAVGIVMVFILLIAVIILCFKRRSRKYQYDSSSYLPTETSELDRGIRLFSIPAKEDQSDKYSSQLTNDYSSSVNDEVTVSQFNGTGSNGKTLTRTTEKRTASDSPFGDSTTLSKKETTDAGFSSTLSNVVSTPSVDSSMERIFFFSDIGHSNTFMNHVYTTFLPANVDNIACAPHIAYSTTEININIGDTLIVDKHLLEGWCIGKNMTQKTQGKFPVYCLTPITNIQLHFVQCFSEDTNRTMPKSVQNIRDWLVGIVFIHQLNLNQLKENEHYMYPIFGTLLGNEQCLVNGTMEFTDYMVSFLKTFGGSFWKDLDISTI